MRAMDRRLGKIENRLPIIMKIWRAPFHSRCRARNLAAFYVEALAGLELPSFDVATLLPCPPRPRSLHFVLHSRIPPLVVPSA